MEVPEVAVKWLTQHASSNLDLARLSNVNRQWRHVVATAILDQVEENIASLEPSASLLLLPSMVRCILTKHSKNSASNEETFCAAWFPPAGIQIQQVTPAGESVWDSDENSDTFAPSGVASYGGSAEERSPSKRSRSPLTMMDASAAVEQAEGPLCSHEWRGYREPFDVLAPFGYAALFVENVLELATGRSPERPTITDSLESLDSQEERQVLKSAFHPENATTIAVRGATLARPEGYCLCWDAPDGTSELQSYASTDSWEAVPREDHYRAVLLRAKRRLILQREVLPRVLLSSKHKNPLDDKWEGAQQPCLQFLNACGSNAVRLFTPPFACGLVEGPITLFLVGIATEDGCFVSGLKRRCELGHMHPVSLRDALIDMSAVCIATDYRIRTQRSSSPTESISASRSQTYSTGAEHADSDDSSCGLDMNQRETGMRCNCPFSETLSQDFEDEDDGPPEECVYRGQRGPGVWHCYVVVFDGEESVIRIDGAPEPLEQGCDDESPAPATLDGLTIGSDHCFDMSLCLGEGSGDEGQGAIAELAVFKGRLSDTDIEQLENNLMRKHGIPKAELTASLMQEDEWRRQARALIAQPSPWSMRVSGVPLPVMAQDRSVAWHRINPVTGKDMRISRIGSKFSNGSSDW